MTTLTAIREAYTKQAQALIDAGLKNIQFTKFLVIQLNKRSLHTEIFFEALEALDITDWRQVTELDDQEWTRLCRTIRELNIEH